MSPHVLDSDLTELNASDVPEGRAAPGRPESFNRRKADTRTRKRARRSRANEMAKRGMHRRRNKRTAW
jgi:hypothetical protein